MIGFILLISLSAARIRLGGRLLKMPASSGKCGAYIVSKLQENDLWNRL